MATCLKRAIKRDPDYPIGKPAPMYLDCGCGQRITWDVEAFVNGTDKLIECPQCHTIYDSRGWIQGKGPKGGA